MSETQYEILEADDGTFAVEVSGGDGEDVVITKFATRREAGEWISAERLRLGINDRWPES